MKWLILIILTLFSFIAKESEISDIKNIKESTHQIEFQKSELNRFIDSMYKAESSYYPDKINRIGAFGAFQFRECTLKSLGYKVSLKQFKKNPDCFPYSVQREAMIKLMQSNENDLKEVIQLWEGKYNSRNILITKSGILAAAHLSGVRHVKNYLFKDIDRKDCNKTTISAYMDKFKSYNF